MDQPILQGLERVARRYRLVRLAWLLSFIWATLAIAFSLLRFQGLANYSIDGFTIPFLGPANAIHLAWFTAIAIGAFAAFSCLFSFRDRRWTAAQVELAHPDLKQRLLTVLDPQQSESPLFLRKQLVAETVQHSEQNSWPSTVPSSKLLFAWAIQLLALILAFYAGAIANGTLHGSAELAAAPFDLSAAASEIIVEPGDVLIERGTDLVVTIRFPEATVPSNVWVESTPEASISTPESIANAIAPTLAAIDGRIPLSRSLSDPVFGGQLRKVSQNIQYRVTAAGYESSVFRVQVFDYPALTKADALVTSPEFLKEPPKRIEDTRRVTLAEGGSVEWQLRVNKPLASVQFTNLRGPNSESANLDEDVVAFEKSQDDPLIWTASMQPTESSQWKLKLQDAEGRNAKFDEKFSIKVLPNEQPAIQLARAQDLRVSPLQEVVLQAKVRDDFGVQRSGVTVSLGDAEPSEITLEGIADKKGTLELKHIVDMEQLQAEPDQLLSYYFWAEDVDASGQTRRVEGDMFFAEVRPFEEIFREGDQAAADQQQNSSSQQQSGSQSAQQAEQLVELQKKVLTSTWNLLRQSATIEHGGSYTADVDTIIDAQKQVLQLTEPLAQALQDERSRKYLIEAQSRMREAVDQLEASLMSEGAIDLRLALGSERNAYEGLLKLRAREHSIVRSRQQSSSSQSQNSSQQNRQEQIDQLELDSEESQYENEQQAQATEPTTADRESRQVMNRLDELAKRQKDLNEQLQQLETALREAKSPEQKEEIEEQLKRLRQNQEEMLRDTDELLDRMDQPDNRQAMQEAREQVEQAREQLQQSSQALAQGETSTARNTGARAQRQMDETREQLRKESSSQLQRNVHNLVDQARRVEKEQQKLQNNFSPSNALPDDATPLRPEGVGEESSPDQKAWSQLKQDVDILLEGIKETVQESESSEPLLAERLYDTYREAMQNKLAQRLDQVNQLLDRGLQEPAERLARDAGPQLERIRSDIESASEQILGSEQESLRRALEELEQSRVAINEELNAQSRGERSKDSQTSNAGRGSGDQQNATDQQNESTEPSETGPANDPRGSAESTQRSNVRDFLPRNSRESNQEGDAQAGESQVNAGNGDAGNGARQEGRLLYGPLTGEGYQDWSDRLRDVEELVRAPELKVDIARVREAARDMRIQYRRHASDPNWDLVEKLIANPLDQIHRKVNEDLLRQAAEKNALVPTDRDPVPRQFQRQLELYYENLGRGATHP